jgi:hypothetical protein
MESISKYEILPALIHGIILHIFTPDAINSCLKIFHLNETHSMHSSFTSPGLNANNFFTRAIKMSLPST